MLTIRQTERRLAVVALWGVAGPFGLGLIQSGLGRGSIALGLLGFALLVGGFVGQVIVNGLYGGGFSRGEIAFGFTAFGIAVLGFVLAWVFDPAFGTADIVVGLSGFAALIACFLVYLIAKYGLKGSFSMFHRTGRH
ncbi:hypothetical protein SAMN06265365_12085 [Tistlia consotensis]|uniref:Uncharacterized protein n=1 Tax=Tistlia consotensis USBA 355 TaxID=560819 RepID=A0A1Y6BUZ6_9PROT|nr:hypothetical protein [Tistlia consotensis]SMF29286.1 hypothetical protein SAMN05428998_11031 [Tistlia consotensis USBA 355]SNR91413.1 hypothetical protein SAMN06265365_12085 [Tistlia consotensis]